MEWQHCNTQLSTRVTLKRLFLALAQDTHPTIAACSCCLTQLFWEELQCESQWWLVSIIFSPGCLVIHGCETQILLGLLPQNCLFVRGWWFWFFWLVCCVWWFFVWLVLFFSWYSFPSRLLLKKIQLSYLFQSLSERILFIWICVLDFPLILFFPICELSVSWVGT